MVEQYAKRAGNCNCPSKVKNCNSKKLWVS